MAATFFAYRSRDASSLAPSEKPAVSPQPPIAIMSLVSELKRLRMVSGDSNGVKDGGESELNSFEGANAIIAVSIPSVLFAPGNAVIWYLCSMSVSSARWWYGTFSHSSMYMAKRVAATDWTANRPSARLLNMMELDTRSFETGRSDY